MEAEYTPDSWLDLLIGDILYYDFSDPTPENFEQSWTKLLDRLKKLMRDVDSHKTGLQIN